jgi:hypothetical protein
MFSKTTWWVEKDGQDRHRMRRGRRRRSVVRNIVEAKKKILKLNYLSACVDAVVRL